MASWRSMLARDLCYLGRYRRGRASAATRLEWRVGTLWSGRSSRRWRRSSSARAGAHDEAETRARAAVATAETETDNVWLQSWSNEDLALVLERAGRSTRRGRCSGVRWPSGKASAVCPLCVASASRSSRSGARRSEPASATFAAVCGRCRDGCLPRALSERNPAAHLTPKRSGLALEVFGLPTRSTSRDPCQRKAL